MNAKTKYRQTMDEAIALLGGQCVECGATERLEFDHVDPATKLFNISAKASRGMHAIRNELTKCQLLCRPCHLIKTGPEISERLSNEHGGGRWGISACDCKLCVRRRLDTNNERRRLKTAERGDRRKIRQLSHKAQTNNASTGVRGVSLTPGESTYKVQVAYRGKRKYVGRFATLEEATEAARKARDELHAA